MFRCLNAYLNYKKEKNLDSCSFFKKIALHTKHIYIFYNLKNVYLNFFH
jgi:hypothetical protein